MAKGYLTEFVPVRVEPSMKRELEKLAVKRRRSTGALIRDILRHELDNNKGAK